MRINILKWIVSVTLAAVFALPVQAQGVANFYKGKTITLIVGFPRRVAKLGW